VVRPLRARLLARSGAVARLYAGEVIVNLDALVTAREAQDYRALRAHHVCRHLIGMWRHAGRLTVQGKRGRSPLYRFGDILRAERDTRVSGSSHRAEGCRSCDRASERSELDHAA